MVTAKKKQLRHLARIGQLVASDKFKPFLPKDELAIVIQVLDSLQRTKSSKNLNKSMKTMDECIALMGFLMSRCRATHNRSVNESKRIAARVEVKVRTALTKAGKPTDKTVSHGVSRDKDFAKAQDDIEDAFELLGHIEAIRSAVYRRHDTLLEISRTERVLLREQ